MFIFSYVEAFIRRFKVSDITNGRIELYSYYFDKWSHSVWRFFVGAGMQNYQEKYDAMNSAHNSIQEILITWGILGLIIVTILLFLILKQAKEKNPKIQIFQYIPFLTCLILSMAGQGFSEFSGILRLMVTYSALMLVYDDNMTQNSEIIKFGKTPALLGDS